MVVDYPVVPSGDQQADWFGVHGNHPVGGRAFVADDALLFALENSAGSAVSCEITLCDDEDGRTLGVGGISWQRGDTSCYCVRFRGFPTRPMGGPMDSCSYQISLRNDADESQGASIWASLYYDQGADTGDAEAAGGEGEGERQNGDWDAGQYEGEAVGEPQVGGPA